MITGWYKYRIQYRLFGEPLLILQVEDEVEFWFARPCFHPQSVKRTVLRDAIPADLTNHILEWQEYVDTKPKPA